MHYLWFEWLTHSHNYCSYVCLYAAISALVHIIIIIIVCIKTRSSSLRKRTCGGCMCPGLTYANLRMLVIAPCMLWIFVYIVGDAALTLEVISRLHWLLDGIKYWGELYNTPKSLLAKVLSVHACQLAVELSSDSSQWHTNTYTYAHRTHTLTHANIQYTQAHATNTTAAGKGYYSA